MKSDSLLQNIELPAEYKNAQVVDFYEKQSRTAVAVGLELLCFTSGNCVKALKQYERPQTQYTEYIQPNWPC